MEIAIIPKWLLKFISSDSSYQYESNILISNLFIISVFTLFKNLLPEIVNALPHFCLFETITGIQCPACGIIRAFFELSKGNIVQACKLNFSSIFVALFFVSQVPLRIFSLCNPQLQSNITKISRWFSWVVLVVMAVNWFIYLAIRFQCSSY